MRILAAGGVVSSTHLENWSPALAALSMPHCATILSDADGRALVAQEPDLRATVGAVRRPRFSDALRSWLDEATRAFPEGTFLRLGSCSFVTSVRGPVRVGDSAAAFRVLAHPGPRVARMALRTLRGGRPLWLFARAWRNIPPWSEFRLFFKARTLVAATQYHSRLDFAGLADRAVAVRDSLRRFAEPLAAALPREDCVADVHLRPAADGFVAGLIEINPFLPVTGSGLFDWEGGGDFDGTLRVRRADHTVASVLL